MSTPTAYLVSGRRTPVGRYGGALSAVRPDDLAALTIKAVVEEAGIDPAGPAPAAAAASAPAQD